MHRTEPTTTIKRPQQRPALDGTRQHSGRRRHLPIALAALSSALALAACGGASKPTSASPRSPNKGSPSSFEQSQLKWAACIRSHGFPTFPDPTFGAGGAQVNLSTNVNMLSPGFKLAQKQCAKLGLFGAGAAASEEKPSAATMAQMVALARCMRAHGVPNFPDPRTTMPRNADDRALWSSVGNMNGVIWAIPKSIDPQSPAVKRAATACGPTAATVAGH